MSSLFGCTLQLHYLHPFYRLGSRSEEHSTDSTPEKDLLLAKRWPSNSEKYHSSKDLYSSQIHPIENGLVIDDKMKILFQSVFQSVQ